MKITLAVVVLLSLVVASMATADFGVILFVNATGSMYPEAIRVGISTVAVTLPWGTTHNPNAPFNIALDGPELLYLDFRLPQQSVVENFTGQIWTDDPNQRFEISSGYISGVHGGPWVVPDQPAIVTIWQDNFQNLQEVTLAQNPIGTWPKILTGPNLKGNWQFNIALTQSPVPEPTSILVLGSGLVWFAGFALRRRR